jgi:hypothetical protein
MIGITFQGSEDQLPKFLSEGLNSLGIFRGDDPVTV